MQNQRLGRMATVNEKGDLQVVPVGLRYNPAVRRQRFAFALLCLTQFMVVLDASVVNVALLIGDGAIAWSVYFVDLIDW